jgi:hypothetical protein
MYEQLRSTVSYLALVCNELVWHIDNEMLNEGYIESCIEELEIGDCSIMSALHNALEESTNNT